MDKLKNRKTIARKLSIYGIIAFILLLFSNSCINPLDGTPPDESPPSLTVYSPTSNDTIYIGETIIEYDAIDDNGLSHYELFINDNLNNTFEHQSGSNNPKVNLFLNEEFKNERITFYLVAYDKSNNKTSSDLKTNILVVDQELPPMAPSNLKLNKVSDTVFNLIWLDQSENEFNFELWRKADTSKFIMIKSLPRNSISTNDTIPIPNIAYSYYVKSVNSSGGAESNIVTSVPDASNITAAPTNLTTLTYGTSRIKLMWKDNSDSELAFTIERKISSGTIYEQIGTVGENDSVFYDTNGLFPTTEYSYRVAAIGQFGLSKWSNTSSIATLSYDIIPPSNLTVEFDQNEETVKLNWKDNSIFDIETRIERSGNDKLFTEIGIAGTNQLNYSDSTAVAGEIYYYRVRSLTVDSYFSEYSNEVMIQF